MTQSTRDGAVPNKPAPDYPKGATPGPWDFGWHQPSGDFTLHYGSDEHTGPSLLEGGLVLADDKANEANAHLLAASPDLYEALFNLVALVSDDTPSAYIDDADAALAKARGEVAK